MSIVLRRTCLKAKNNVLPSANGNSTLLSSYFTSLFFRSHSEDKTGHPEFVNSTILVENGLNVQELPVIVRKLTSLTEIDGKPPPEDASSYSDPASYHLIQAEFKQCFDLRDVFSLLSKCTKITPNIALGAMERIYDLERDHRSHELLVEPNNYVNMAKGAIVDKLVRVVTKTEDTQTILNVLQTVSTFMNPYKHKFCDELLFRAIDNKLTIEQLCEFIKYLDDNKHDPKYSETVDKLWVGFVQREAEIDAENIVRIFAILPALKASKRAIFNLLEQKFFDLWYNVKVSAMRDILNRFLEEKYSSVQTFAAVGRWLYTNIHALDEDSLLDVITKLTHLNYTDIHVEKAVEKYMKLKTSKIESHILIVGVLNYCKQFQIRNETILNTCSDYYIRNGNIVPPSFTKSFIYPFGFLKFNPQDPAFWDVAENEIKAKFYNIPSDDLSLMLLSFLYLGRHPIGLVNKMLSPEYLVKVGNPETLKRFHLIDTALSLECIDYNGPLLPKDQCSEPVTIDGRVKNITNKIMDSLIEVSVGADKISTGVLVPHLHSGETYLIDVMLHPSGLGSNTFNWKIRSAKNENTAILIHLPDHYCSDNETLIGPQELRRRQLKLLGLKVVSLKYSVISQFYTSYNTDGLKKYLCESIANAEISK